MDTPGLCPDPGYLRTKNETVRRSAGAEHVWLRDLAFPGTGDLALPGTGEWALPGSRLEKPGGRRATQAMKRASRGWVRSASGVL